MKRSLICSALLAACLTSAALAQVRLEPKFPEGTSTGSETKMKFHQVLTIAGMDLTSEVDTTVTGRATIGKRMPDGTIRVEERTEAVVTRMTLPGGLKVDFDSAKPDVKAENPALQPILDAFRGISGAGYAYVIGKDNKVASIEALQKPGQTAPVGPGQPLDPEKRKKELGQELAVLPEKPVNKGDKWERTEVVDIGGGQTLTFTNYYEYQGTVEKSGKTLDKISLYTGAVTYALDPNSPSPAKVVNSDLKIGGSMGTLLFDRERGQVVESTNNLKINGTLTLSVNGMELPAKMDLSFDTSITQK